MKKLLAIALAAMTGGLFAETYTWTGNAATSDYATPGNWSVGGETAAQVPSQTDTVVIDGANVTVNGSYRIPSSLTLSNNASWSIGGEIQFGDNGVENLTIYGGTVSGTLVAAQYANAVLTISDAAIIDTATGNNGFWQNNGSYLNFVDGSSRAASFTYNNTMTPGKDPFWFFSNTKDGNATTTSPCIRYNNAVIDRATYDDNFTATDNGNDTTTLSMKALSGWKVAKPTLGEVADGQVTVTYTATKYSGGNATITIGCASSDLGNNIAAWAGKTTEAATGVTDTRDGSATVTLAAGVNYIRVFVSYDDTTVASPAVTAQNIVYGDYGELTGVYEYIGTDNDLNKASNWAFNRNPLSDSDTPPTAGTSIRWFGYNAVYSGTLAITDHDYFNGANLSLSGDCKISSDIAFTNSTIQIYTIVVEIDGITTPQLITLYGSNLTTTRSDMWIGVWPPSAYNNAPFINFASGAKSSFTYTDTNNFVADKAAAKTMFFDTGRFYYNGAALTDSAEDAAIWNEHFTVDADSATHTVTITYNPEVEENRISAVSAAATSTSATLTATVGAVAGIDVKVYFAYSAGTTEPDDAAILAGTDLGTTAADATVTTTIDGLTAYETYTFVFGLVRNGSVVAKKGGSFVAKDYDAIFDGTTWNYGSDAALNDSSKSVYVTGSPSYSGEISTPKKTFENARVGSSTLITGTSPIILRNSALIVSRRDTVLHEAPYGLYPPAGSHFVDFRHDAPAAGVIYGASSYTFKYADGDWAKPTDADIFSDLFGGKKFLVDGEETSAEDAENLLTVIDNNPDASAGTVTLTTVDELDATATGDWTIQSGAYVKLTANVKLGAVTIPNSADVKIDTNGHTLKVASLTVDGEVKKGEYTKDTASWIVGEGSVVVGKSGLALILR